jgi:hypothetical protein
MLENVPQPNLFSVRVFSSITLSDRNAYRQFRHPDFQLVAPSDQKDSQTDRFQFRTAPLYSNYDGFPSSNGHEDRPSCDTNVCQLMFDRLQLS